MLSPANHGRAIFMLAGSLFASAVNLNGPGRYLHWSVFIVSEANLVLIAVMVVIFGAALLIPFPGHGANKPVVGSEDGEDADTSIGDSARRSSSFDLGDDADAVMWTSRLRRSVLRR